MDGVELQIAEFTIRSQPEELFDGWLGGVVERWGKYRSASGRMSEESARQAATRITSKLLPEASQTDNQRILQVLHGDNVVAVFWLEVKGMRGFLYDLVNHDPEFESELLPFIEEAARSFGASELRLNVFSSDELLVRLARDDAFVILNSQMWMLDAVERLRPADVSTLVLRPMTTSEFPAYYEQEVILYAEAKVLAGKSTPEAAMEESIREVEKLLPNGLESEGQYMFVAEINNVRVGTVWIEIDLEAEVPRAFGLDVEIAESLRGQGLGRAILLATLLECRKLGARGLALSVFGHNFVARNLYTSLGFEVVEEMKKKNL